MEATIGIQGRDFAMIACDANSPFSVLNLDHDSNKFYRIGRHLVMSVIGEMGDQQMFGDYISKNLKLYEMRHGYNLKPDSAAYFVRNQLATAIRSRNPYMVNVMVGGWDDTEGASLYYIDYLGTLSKVNFGAHGYANMFTTGLLDKEWRDDITEERAYELIVKGLNTLHLRFLINIAKLKVVVVDKNGVRQLPDARPTIQA